MAFLLNFLPRLIASETGAADLNRLSETGLMAQYPAVATTTFLLLGIGFLCDLYLLSWLNKRLSATERDPLLRVGPKPWSLRDLSFATGALVLILATGNAVVVIGLKLSHRQDVDAMPWMLGSNMFLYVLSLVGFLGFFRRRQISFGQALGFRRESALGALLFGALLFFAVLPPLAGTFVVYDKLCHLIGVTDTPQPVTELLASTDSVTVIVLVSLFAVIVAPVFEELFFRGFIYPVLKERWGTWKALTAVSAIFAVIHQHVPSMGPLFTLALGLGLAYELTGSLLAPIAVHALFNTMNVAVLLYVRAHS